MAEWLRSHLGDIAELRIGKTPPRGSARYWSPSGGYPWATIADLRNDPVVDTAERISEAGLTLAGRSVAPGSVLLSFKLTIGRVARAGVALRTNEAIASVRAIKGAADESWLYHALPSMVRDGIADTAVKGPTLNMEKLQRLSVLVPPLEEQRRIAEALDSADDAIRSSECVIAKRRQVRAGLAFDLLRPTPDDSTSHALASRQDRSQSAQQTASDDPAWYLVNLHRELPAGWDVKSLGQIGRFLRGTGGTKRDEAEDGFPCVRYGDLYTLDECSIRGTRLRIRPDRRHSYTKLNYGDLLFAGSGETLDDIGASAVNLMRERAYCGGDVIILRPTVGIDPGFLGHVADCESSRLQKSRLGSGSTVMHIYPKQLQNLVIPVPPLEEQRRIAQILDASDDAIRAEQGELAKLRQLRAGLAADLLSGRVRTVAT